MFIPLIVAIVDTKQEMQHYCDSAANILLNELRVRTDEYYYCTVQLDIQQLFVLRVSFLFCFEQYSFISLLHNRTYNTAEHKRASKIK